MLSLATHEPHFAILRERRGGKGGGRRGGRGGGHGDSLHGAASTGGGGEPLEVLRVGTLREYLDRELREADWSGVRGGFDLERAIDDFVFLCFFVGNDFLPHMPGLEIREGALEGLLLLYKSSVSSKLRGYLTNNGDVNLVRLGALVRAWSDEAQLLHAKVASEHHERRKREDQYVRRSSIGWLDSRRGRG